MAQKLAFLLTKDELNRIKFTGDSVVVDLHYLSVKEARRLLKTIVALYQKSFCMVVIHGYIHGQALKEMLRTDDIFLKEHNMIATENPGRTLFEFV